MSSSFQHQQAFSPYQEYYYKNDPLQKNIFLPFIFNMQIQGHIFAETKTVFCSCSKQLSLQPQKRKFMLIALPFSY